MTDCYRILGVHPAASAAEIRAAYLARMKRLHPDAGPASDADTLSASDITYAYWRLRDPERRADHDREWAQVAGRDRAPPRAPLAKAKASDGRHRGAVARRPTAQPATRQKSRPRRLGSRLQPFRAAVGVTVCGLAAVSFVLTFSYLQPEGQARERSLRAVDAELPTALKPARVPDADTKRSAVAQFRSIMTSSGQEGAHLFGRQCLYELGARPSLAMLDYCLAFDSEGADWEQNRSATAPGRRYFTAEQRLTRYREAARDLRGVVRDALMNEANHLAAGSRSRS